MEESLASPTNRQTHFLVEPGSVEPSAEPPKAVEKVILAAGESFCLGVQVPGFGVSV